MRTALTLLLVFTVSACGGRRRTDDWDLPDIYRTDKYYKQDLSKYDKQLPQRLRSWKWNVLDRANFLSTLQMRKDASRRLLELDDRLDKLRQMAPNTAHGKIELLEIEVRYTNAQIQLIKRHLARSPLPLDEAQKLQVWYQTVLRHSTIRTAVQMREDSKDRISWLEGKITELDTHHKDVVWKDYLHFNLMLHFEVTKLGLIDRRMKG